jgi:deaminated glutathione amidase
MTTSFSVSGIQFTAGPDPEPNLQIVSDLIRRARDGGADLIMTPEASNFIESGRRRRDKACSEAEDPFLAGMRSLARETGAWLLVGSLVIDPAGESGAAGGGTRLANRSFLVDSAGAVVARYDKIHMFDIDLPGGESYRESANYQPGETAVISDLPWGRIGLTICYDVRFPALYRALAESGASFLTVPSAFTRKTGEAHWHTLLRARAIETGCFVFAAAQAGLHENERETYGHSLIVDPWGEVLAEGGVEPGVFMAKIDPAKVGAARQSIPSLQHGRRFSVVDPKNGPDHLHLVRGSA